MDSCLSLRKLTLFKILFSLLLICLVSTFTLPPTHTHPISTRTHPSPTLRHLQTHSSPTHTYYGKPVTRRFINIFGAREKWIHAFQLRKLTWFKILSYLLLIPTPHLHTTPTPTHTPTFPHSHYHQPQYPRPHTHSPVCNSANVIERPEFGYLKYPS